MKRIINAVITLVGLTIMFSCEKDQLGPTLNLNDATAPAISAPTSGNSFDLVSYQEDFIFQWAASNYNMDDLPQVTYRVVAYLSSDEQNFQHKMTVLSETILTADTISAAEINQVAFQLGATPLEFEEITFRVMSYLTISSNATWLFSNPVVLDIRSYEVFTMAYVPGSYQGWDNDNEATVIYSPKADNIFEGYFYFSEPNTEIQFLFKGSSENYVYGDNQGNGTLDQNGSSIVISQPGVYRIRLDFIEMEYTVFKTEWALIGSAADGWDTDVPMEMDEDFWTDNWKVRYNITREMVSGAFKFRANGAWDLPAGLNMGIDDDSEEEGVLMYFGYGNDIPISTDGTYEITLNLSGPLYRYQVTVVN